MLGAYFTPLEFETVFFAYLIFGHYRLKFTPLEFEICFGSNSRPPVSVKIYLLAAKYLHLYGAKFRF